MRSLSEEQRLLVGTVDDLAREKFAERAFKWNGDAPWPNLESLSERGFLGINFDEEYGGGGMSEYEAMLLIEVVGRVCPDTAYFLADQHFLAPRAIHEFGTNAAKEKYLRPVTAGEDRIAIAMSEPEAGSDLKSMSTTATEEGTDLVLNGEKTWVSNVPHCSAAVVWTQFGTGNYGTVVVEFDWNGIEIAQHHTNMAGHDQTQFYMEDVAVPEENVLTRGPDGFKKNLRALNWERLGSATASAAFARCGLEKALKYAQQRTQFGQPIGDFQGIEWKLADMTKDLEAARSLIYRTAEEAIEAGQIPDPLLSTLAKLHTNEMVEEVVSEALQVHGANGYQQGHPLEYLYRFARGQRIAAGTDEIAKNTIARLLKRDGLPPLI